MRKYFVICIVLLASIGIWAPVSNSDNQIIKFGTKPDEAWVKKNLGKDFPYNVVMTIQLEDKTAVLYQYKKISKIVLSFFQDGQEQLLWDFKVGDAVLSALVPRPVLATSYLNANKISDLIFIYSINTGGGIRNEYWNREMLLFIDGVNTDIQIPLSAVDFSVYRSDKNTKYGSNLYGKNPANRKESIVIFSPISKSKIFNMFVWSKVVQFRTPKEEKENVTYKLTKYEITNSQPSKTDLSDRDITDFIFQTLMNRKGIITLY